MESNPLTTRSVLNSVKEALGIDEEYNIFDMDILAYINGALSTAYQLGAVDDVTVMDETTTFGNIVNENTQLNALYMYLITSVRLTFDPPQNSFLVKSLEDRIQELQWRLCIHGNKNTYKKKEDTE